MEPSIDRDDLFAAVRFVLPVVATLMFFGLFLAFFTSERPVPFTELDGPVLVVGDPAPFPPTLALPLHGLNDVSTVKVNDELFVYHIEGIGLPESDDDLWYLQFPVLPSTKTCTSGDWVHSGTSAEGRWTICTSGGSGGANKDSESSP